jgi:radical SAM superfamily enzyme YgiQ (UPF0313 family)
LLEASGCVAVNLGVQTTSEKLRKEVLCRYDTNVQVANALQLLMKTKIYVYVDIILGIPGQDENEIIDIIQFLNKNKPDYVLINWLRYYPRTEVTNMMFKKGRLTADDVKNIESCREYIPFTYITSSFDPRLGKLGNLIITSMILPFWLINLIISKKLYRYLNTSTYLPLRLYAFGLSIFNAISSPKKRLLYFTPTWQLKYHVYWSGKKMLMKLKTIFKK